MCWDRLVKYNRPEDGCHPVSLTIRGSFLENRDMDKEEMRQVWNDRGMNIDKDCLCSMCECVNECEWAYDLYNFGDSCLGMK